MGGGRWLLPPVRGAHKQNRRDALLEEGELEFFKVNEIACLLQSLRNILRGTIVAGCAGGSVATTHGGDVLERPQVTKGALGRHPVECRNSITDDVFRPGNSVWQDCNKQCGGETNPAWAKGLLLRCIRLSVPRGAILSVGRAANKVRSGDQCQNRPGARPGRAELAACPRRTGCRVALA